MRIRRVFYISMLCVLCSPLRPDDQEIVEVRKHCHSMAPKTSTVDIVQPNAKTENDDKRTVEVKDAPDSDSRARQVHQIIPCSLRQLIYTVWLS